MRCHVWMVLSIPLVMLAGSALAQTAVPPAERFRTLLDDDWKFWMGQYPEVATAIGFPGQDARWTDYSPGAIASRNDYLRRTMERLNGIERTRLAAADQLNYDLYRDMIATAVQGLEFGNDAMPMRGVIPHNLQMPINQMEGVQQDVPRVISLMPAAGVADYENIVLRLRAVPALVDQTIALMKQGLAQGLTPPQVTLRDVAGQVAAQIVADARTSPLLDAFGEIPGRRRGRRSRPPRRRRPSPPTRRPCGPPSRGSTSSSSRPTCPPAATRSAPTRCPKGAEMYAYNVRWHTTTATTPKEIHEIGLAEVKRIRAEMDAIIAKVGFKGTFDDFKQFLRTNPAFYYTDAAALVSGYRDVAKRADPELARLFGTLPRTPYGVARVPDATAPSQTTAYYEPGALAAGRPGNMYANTYKLDARPKWEMEALTLHEAVPGHHLQIALAQELEGLPEFRKNTSYTAFVEGWALYAESLGDEMGFYQDPYSKFGQLTYEMWRAVRLVVDTGLHSMGWTRQQAIDFFAANAAKTLQDITVEVDRYIVWPGQALGLQDGPAEDPRAAHERRAPARADVRRARVPRRRARTGRGAARRARAPGRRMGRVTSVVSGFQPDQSTVASGFSRTNRRWRPASAGPGSRIRHMLKHAVLTLSCALALAGLAQNPPAPPVQPSTRPPENNDETLRPLTSEEIPPNLNFYAIDPLYKPGAPLGWAATRIVETLDRGMLAVAADGGHVYLGWRLLENDPAAVSFNVYRSTNGGPAVKLNAQPVAKTTDFLDTSAPLDRENAWWVKPVINGREQEDGVRATLPASPPARPYKTIALRDGDARRRSRRHRRSQRRRHLRLRRQTSGREHRSRTGAAQPRHVQGRCVRRQDRRVPVANRSRLERESRHLVLADGGPRSGRRQQGGSVPADRAVRRDAGAGVRRRQGVRPRRAGVPGGLRRPDRQGDRQGRLDRAGQGHRLGRHDRQSLEPPHARASRTSTGRPRACWWSGARTA